MEQTFVPENETGHLKILASAKPKVRIHWSSFLPRSRSKLVFAVTMAAYALALSSLVSVLLGAIHAERPPREFYRLFHYPVLGPFLLLILAPLFESLILITPLELVRLARAPNAVQIFAAAWVISFLHIRPWMYHPFIVFPSFCIQAVAYLYWRRESWKAGYKVVVLIHALCNLIPAISAAGYRF